MRDNLNLYNRLLTTTLIIFRDIHHDNNQNI